MSSSILPTHARALRPELPQHIGIINDYLRIPYANGSSFASQFLYREFTRRGHRVTVMGPHAPGAEMADLPKQSLPFGSLPLHNHPGLFLALPSPDALAQALAAKLDLVLAQTGSGLLELGVWLRASAGVPLLCVNTIHMPSVYNVLLPDALHAQRKVTDFFDNDVIPRIERSTARAYNLSDGLVVLSAGLERYWRERGVTVPIHVIPRSVQPALLEGGGADPFPREARRGSRLLCVCRHTREKNVERLIRLFAREILPHAPDASLTLVGDGPDHDAFVALARSLGVAERVHFPGEYPVGQVSRFYRHADVFVYASLSETYGQVVSEALWCGLPVIAFEDVMGVSQQIDPGKNGALIAPGPDEARADQRFAAETLALLQNPNARRALGEQAARLAHERSDPDLCIMRYYAAFLEARTHCAASWRPAGVSTRALNLVRWAGVHALLSGLSHLRPPAVLNRHGRRQPGWEEPLETLAPEAASPSLKADAFDDLAELETQASAA